MTITQRVQSQYFQKDQELIRLAPNQDQARSLPTKRAGTPWTLEEHELFLEALECYPSGPWKTIAAHIGTRTTRQTMTHAQKYHRGRESAKDSESTHARQKRKEEDNKRIKDAFGIATDYVAGESFDPEMQERRRQERKEKREQEWKQRRKRGSRDLKRERRGKRR
ncbi:hypothetical protein AM588_10006929 [Phytophthora nicotianae]|uniref:Uncharacterized protein n=1 Tax=Phytophthora nicotianae TaxID=4792 RepID=A0A0W8DC02_PHYNI|nr:hypothetical protein AM588_10006929 [Phytophthora nicotianae]